MNRTKNSNNLPITGKLPPQAIDLEEGVLGAIILKKEAITMVGSILSPQIFYKDAHKTIYEAIQRLYKESRPIDLLTVTNELRKMGKLEEVGGAWYVTELTSKISSSANIEHHCRILQEQYMKRESIAFGAELMRLSFDDTTDTFDIIEKGTAYTLKMTGMVDNGRMVTVKSAMMDFLEGLGRAMNRKEGELSGITSGINAVDRITGGWKSPDLIIIAGRVAMGKTSFVIRCIVSAAKAGNPVGMFSLEMSSLQLVTRIAAQTYRIASVQDLKNGNISQDKFDYLVQKADKVVSLPIQMDDTAGISLSQLRSKAYTMVRKQGVKLIVIDYLQLIQADEGSGTREQQVSSISRGLKKLAKELEIPVIALSQLSRAVETRGGDGRPKLSDLRECLPTDEWVSTPEGPVQLKTKPNTIITSSTKANYVSNCNFIEKRYNKVYDIKSQYGNFRATGNHLVLTGTGWKQVNQLNPKRDVLASVKQIPHRNKGAMPHARFLGWMIGNGGFSGTPSLIYRKEFDELVRQEVEKFGVEVKYRKTQKSDNVFDTYLSNGTESGSLKNPLMVWLRSLGLENLDCYNKIIPQEYMGSSDETHIELLKGLWEADGTVSGGRAKYCTVSETLARQVSWLLLTCGIRSKVQYYDRIWEVAVSAVDNENMEKIVNHPIRFGKLSKPNERYIDPCPVIFIELIKELYPQSGFKLQKKSSGEYKNISKNRIEEIMMKFPISTIIESPFLSMDHLGWGRIYSVDKIDADVRVCDLHVPRTNNFVTNGIVVHNSGGIEADSDVVAFLYRPEYYGITQDEAGNSLHGVAELIFAKHRDGPLDSAVMKFLGQYTDFEDIHSFEPIEVKNELDYTHPRSFKNDGTNEFMF